MFNTSLSLDPWVKFSSCGNHPNVSLSPGIFNHLRPQCSEIAEVYQEYIESHFQMSFEEALFIGSEIRTEHINILCERWIQIRSYVRGYIILKNAICAVTSDLPIDGNLMYVAKNIMKEHDDENHYYERYIEINGFTMPINMLISDMCSDDNSLCLPDKKWIKKGIIRCYETDICTLGGLYEDFHFDDSIDCSDEYQIRELVPFEQNTTWGGLLDILAAGAKKEAVCAEMN